MTEGVLNGGLRTIGEMGVQKSRRPWLMWHHTVKGQGLRRAIANIDIFTWRLRLIEYYYYYLHYQVIASRDLGRPLNSVGETDHAKVTEEA